MFRKTPFEYLDNVSVLDAFSPAVAVLKMRLEIFVNRFSGTKILRTQYLYSATIVALSFSCRKRLLLEIPKDPIPSSLLGPLAQKNIALLVR